MFKYNYITYNNTRQYAAFYFIPPLFPLIYNAYMNADTPITDIGRIDETHKKALKRLGIVTVRDLLYHFPTRYGDTAETKNITGLTPGEAVTLFGKVEKLKAKKAWKSKIPMTEGTLTDDTGSIKLIWFSQPYIAKMIGEGSLVRIDGKVSERNGVFSINNPKIEKVTTLPTGVGNSLFGEKGSDHHLYPVYRETKGITSNWMYHAIQKVFTGGTLETLKDPIPEDILKRYKLPTLSTALVWIHTPKNEKDALAARKRFSFEEIFLLGLQKEITKRTYHAQKAHTIKKSYKDLEPFTKGFPFTPTKAQTDSIKTILKDFSRGIPMTRLLEGDVGSGKTAVAATTIYATATTRPPEQDFGFLQTAYMVPTEVLAKQHFESFIEFFRDFPIPIALITGSECRKFPSKTDPNGWTKISKAQLKKWVANGEIPVVIGTHALIQKSVEFKHLAYIIIDEQHRFGTRQRAALVARGMYAKQTRKDAELSQKTKLPDLPNLLHKDLSYAIRSALFEVKNKLGSGHKEIVYQKALAEEFVARKITFSKEVQIPIMYRNKKVGVYQPDFVVDEKIIVELKALPFLGATEKKQLWTYLKGSEYKLGLLVNFGPKELEIKRVVYDTARNNASASDLRVSASVPHLLSMTATPIPRTLALTIYGDLDLTVIDQMPKGRKPVITEIVTPDKREGTYAHMKKELEAGRQAYVICPRIDEPDPDKQTALNVKSVKAEAERLKENVFPEYAIDILHSKMTPAEKEATMQKFKEHKTHILCATSVVEVGVNVPNATVILIEGAQRFGLAQLHQLRGRVIRSNHQAYCYLFADTKSSQSLQRLSALTKAKNGFELAEYDLQFRGPGELAGGKQSGITDIGMEALSNIKLVEAVQTETRNLLDENPDLSQFPLLKTLIEAKEKDVHLE